MDRIKEYIAGGIASVIAEILTLPLDTIKVRLQLVQKKERYKAFLSLLEEGPSSLFHGLDAALIRQILYGSLRFGFYPQIKQITFSILGEEVFIARLIAGLLSGSISSGICNPTDLIKIRMQGQGKVVLVKKDDSPKQILRKQFDNSSLKYDNAYQAFLSILKDEGIKGLYKGVIPTMARAGVLASAELATYDVLKEYIALSLKKDNTSVLVHMSTKPLCQP